MDLSGAELAAPSRMDGVSACICAVRWVLGPDQREGWMSERALYFWLPRAAIAAWALMACACGSAPGQSVDLKDGEDLETCDAGGTPWNAGDLTLGGGDAVDGPGATACTTDADCALYTKPNCRIGKCGALLHCTVVDAPDGLACQDGQVCTQGDTCAAGSCKGGAPSCGSCAVDSDCKPLGAGHPCNGLYYCGETPFGKACLKPTVEPFGVGAPLCLVGCPSSGDSVQHCDWATEKCIDGPYKAPGTCDDGDPCTVADRCSGGTCSGEVKPCLDGASCTADQCDPATGQCQHTAEVGACSQGAACSGDVGCVTEIPCPNALVGLGSPATCTAAATQLLQEQRPAALSADVVPGLALVTTARDPSGKCKALQVLHYAESGLFESLRLSAALQADCSDKALAAGLSGQKARLGVVQAAVNETQGALRILDAQGQVGATVALPWLTSGERKLLPRQPDGWWLVQYAKLGSYVHAIPLDIAGQLQGAPVKLAEGSNLPLIASTPAGLWLTVQHPAGSASWHAQWRDTAGQLLGPELLLGSVAPAQAKSDGSTWSDVAVAVDDDAAGGLLAWRDALGSLRILRWDSAGQNEVKVDLPGGPGAMLVRRGADGWALLTLAYVGIEPQLLALPLSKQGAPTGGAVRLDVDTPSGAPFFAVGHANGRLSAVWATAPWTTALRTTGW